MFQRLLIRVTNRAVWIAILVLSFAPQFSFAGDCNDVVLEQVRQMPKGGRYSVSHFAKIRLQSSAHFESGKFFIIPAGRVSFGRDVSGLYQDDRSFAQRGQLNLDFGTLEHLIIRDQHDGEDVWGRWNANGPGTACLFHELRLGRNFDNIDQAKPGDFMKIFWSRQVGRNEHGHSTIFLERRTVPTVNTFGIGRVMFPPVTARRVCREAKSCTQFFRVSKRRPI